MKEAAVLERDRGSGVVELMRTVWSVVVLIIDLTAPIAVASGFCLIGAFPRRRVVLSLGDKGTKKRERGGDCYLDDMCARGVCNL